jgi:hypothetical protein
MRAVVFDEPHATVVHAKMFRNQVFVKSIGNKVANGRCIKLR